MSRLVALIFALIILVGLPRTASAIYIRDDVSLASYVALASDPAYAATGYLRAASGQFCTATLVSPTTILSAAHCFVFTGGPRAGTVALPSDVMFGLGDSIAPFVSNVGTLALNPLFDINNFDPMFDEAILTVTTPFLGVTPAAIWAGDPTGLIATIVGYGGQGTGVSNGLPGAPAKLAAQNVIDIINPDSIEFDFDSPNGAANKTGQPTPLPLEGTPATGDSGSPLFVTLGGAPFIVGTLFGGIGNNFYGDLSFYARVNLAENQQFLTSHGVTFASAVPEPATLTLLGAGLAATLARRRSKARLR